jgi:hypothetical protein
MRANFLCVVGFLLAGLGAAWAQTSSLIDRDSLEALIAESSGELALEHFTRLLRFSGYAPSLGAEQSAEYLAERAREFGLSDVRIEELPSDGEFFYWAYHSEPWWEGDRGELWLVEPEVQRIASFDAHRGHLARFSRDADVTAELVDVGEGTKPSDYEGKSIAGKIVLATGPPGLVHRRAVWEQKAAGVVFYRTEDHLSRPDLVGSMEIRPWKGRNGEPPAFVFSLSYRAGRTLADRLETGERLVVRVEVDAETTAGYYPQVHAVIRGTEPGLSEVWIQAHPNHRNSGGGNNLTGVGATIDLARTLASLIREGVLDQPRRNIRFLWGAEHAAILAYFHQNPDAVPTVLAMLNLDMVGDDQDRSESYLRLYRTPHSLPSFVNDVVQEMFEIVGTGNSAGAIPPTDAHIINPTIPYLLPILEPSGSRDEFFYTIEEFWGPSDHEDVVEASLGVPAVMLNSWPDPYIGTNQDTRERADATQMKRAIVITGASAYAMASAGPEDIPALAQNALSKARARLAREQRRAMDLVWSSSSTSVTDDYRQARNILSQAHQREAEALRTLHVFAETEDARVYLDETVESLAAGESRALKELDGHAKALAKARGWELDEAPSPPPEGIATLVPVRNLKVRGPVSFFRDLSGAEWLYRTLGDEDFASKVRLASRGDYYLLTARESGCRDVRRGTGVAVNWDRCPFGHTTP